MMNRTGCGVSFFTASAISRLSMAVCPVSISTTPSEVTTMLPFEFACGVDFAV